MVVHRFERDPHEEGSMSEPPPEQPYELPDTEPAWEPSTLPDRPLTAVGAAPFVSKIVSLGDQ